MYFYIWIISKVATKAMLFSNKVYINRWGKVCHSNLFMQFHLKQIGRDQSSSYSYIIIVSINFALQSEFFRETVIIILPNYQFSHRTFKNNFSIAQVRQSSEIVTNWCLTISLNFRVLRYMISFLLWIYIKAMDQTLLLPEF